MKNESRYLGLVENGEIFAELREIFSSENWVSRFSFRIASARYIIIAAGQHPSTLNISMYSPSSGRGLQNLIRPQSIRLGQI